MKASPLPMKTPSNSVFFGTCDGVAMGQEGMRYSLVSRKNIADSIELMVQALRFDGIVSIGTCDKIVPGIPGYLKR